jgi:hypothetical protein
VIHLDDGQQAEMPLVIGRDLADWWKRPGEINTTFVVAWTGTNEASRQRGSKIRLFKSTWENPRPGAVVETIDVVSTKNEVAPFVVAITAEP